MRLGRRASLCAWLLLGALLLHWQYGKELWSLARHCVSSHEQAEADRDAAAACQVSLEEDKRRLLDFARCYRSCLFLCTKKGLRGSKDEMRLACTSCTTQCEALAGVRESELAALG